MLIIQIVEPMKLLKFIQSKQIVQLRLNSSGSVHVPKFEMKGN
jgi:hypothetical protein